MDPIADLREDLLTASQILDNEGLVEGYGHVSARLPGRDAMVMTPRKGLGLLEIPREMVLVGFDGALLEGDGPVALEAAMHSAIYRKRPDVHALVRTHSTYVNIMGILGKSPRVVHGFGSFLGERVPIFPKPFLIVSPELGEELAECLGDAQAALLRGNGDLVTGRSIAEATVKAIFLEESCRLQYLALCAGEPAYFSPEEIEVRREPGYDHWGRAWEYYRARLE